MKKAVPFILVFLVAGCGGMIKHSWNNFTAYYNTFYNAKKNFESGVAKVKDQPFQYIPGSLVLPHPVLPKAGAKDFEQAEQDAIHLLRHFPASKWTNDALFMLSKIYYYQHEFFKARQKFNEVIDLHANHTYKAQAVIWKGRILLNIHSYKVAIQFLNDKLVSFDSNSKNKNKAEVRVLIAENYAKLGQWKKAAKLLSRSLPEINNRVMRIRGYFLLGQVWQKSGIFEKAFTAFQKVKNSHPGDALLYWSGIKEIETARLAGRLKQATTIGFEMASDDRNYRRLSEIYYQQALNYLAKQQYQKSEQYFKKALSNRNREHPAGLIAQIYFRLGMLYSKHLNDYNLAVAYFDSSSAQNYQAKLVIQASRTSKNAVYVRYAKLKQDIHRADRLLYLGSLSERELRNKLRFIRVQNRRAKLKKQNLSESKSSILNYRANRRPMFKRVSETSSTYGFLNYKNPRLVRKERQKFIAVWGQRPLVDNWRRIRAISGVSGKKLDRAGNPRTTIRRSTSSITVNSKIQSLLDDIPRTEVERNNLRNQRLKDMYQLGNLFFLTLSKPDSATVYYHRILKKASRPHLRAQTYYSLYRLYRLNDQPDSSSIYRQKLMVKFPQSNFAKDILKRREEHFTDSAETLITKMHQILADHSSFDSANVGLKLQELAVNHQDDKAAPAVYFKGIRKYIQFVKARPVGNRSVDSSQVARKISGNYKGKNWDNVRSMLTRFLKLFPNAPQRQKVNSWLSVLTHARKETIPTCKELGIKPEIIGGKKNFIKSVKLPQKVQRMNISGTVRFQLTINRNGRVVSVKLLSQPTHLGIESAYEKAIKNSLRFKPLQISDKWSKVFCAVSFPIQLNAKNK